jgi:hypothetical protein
MPQDSPPLIQIAYPEPGFQLRTLEGGRMIWDQVRKKYVRLTPEEWVRQNFLHYLISVKGYPASLMAIEKELRVGTLRKRGDIVVYQRALPWMIVECKAPDIEINEKTLRQILAYNVGLPARYLILTNGRHTYGIRRKGATAAFVDILPEYDSPGDLKV